MLETLSLVESVHIQCQHTKRTQQCACWLCCRYAHKETNSGKQRLVCSHAEHWEGASSQLFHSIAYSGFMCHTKKSNNYTLNISKKKLHISIFPPLLISLAILWRWRWSGPAGVCWIFSLIRLRHRSENHPKYFNKLPHFILGGGVTLLLI